MDEEDQKLVVRHDTREFRRKDVDDEEMFSRKRRLAALLILFGFFLVVAIAVSWNKQKLTEATGFPVDSSDGLEPIEFEGEDDTRDDDYTAYKGDTEDGKEDVQDGLNELSEDTDEGEDKRTESTEDDGDVPIGTNDKPVKEDEKGEEDEGEGESDEIEALKDVKEDDYEEGGINKTIATKSPPKRTDAKEGTSGKVTTIWDLDLNAIGTGKTIIEPNKAPALVFVKGVKVGGTSVALALNHAAQTHSIRLGQVEFERNKQYNYVPPTCNAVKGTLYFRHGYRNPWQWNCIKNVKHVTVLRDPISQILSYESYLINFVQTSYFLHYPTKSCSNRQFIDVNTRITDQELVNKFRSVDTCNDTPFRRNLTMIYAANQIRALKPNDPGKALRWTATWIATAPTYRDITAESLVEVLNDKYFMVGVTERINEFLVLLALTNGWDLSTMYYEKCKLSNLDIPKLEFAKHFPDLMAKIERSSLPVAKAYQWAREQFNDRISKLGDWFKERVKQFEEGLREYQRRKHPDPNVYQWREMRYVDGKTDAC